MNDFRKALAWTAIPIVVVSILSTFERLGWYFSFPMSFAWFGAAGLWVLAIIVAAGFALTGKRQAVSGMVVGIAIGILALGVTCFANIDGRLW